MFYSEVTSCDVTKEGKEMEIKTDRKTEEMISGEELIQKLREKAVAVVDRVTNNTPVPSNPINFEFEGEIHVAGIIYDTLRAAAEQRPGFCEDLLSLYLDKTEYNSMECFRNNAKIQKTKLKDIPKGIHIV